MTLETPCVIIDKQRMMRNIKDMAAKASSHHVKLRPHTKTHKIPALAKEQVKAGAVGITVAKISEAEVMAAHGLDDIFIAYPIIVPSKIERVVHLSRKIQVIIGVDSIEGARRVSEIAEHFQQPVTVRLEVDTGLQRTGVLYEQAGKLAYEIEQLPYLHLQGIYTFRGSLLNGKPTLDREKAGLEEGQLMVSLAEEIRKAGIALEEVSVGSTPTAEFAAQVKGVTEIRPGTYIFQDMMQVKMGVSRLDDCAATVMATVVSRPAAGRMVIDGGSKTFATDIQPATAPLYLDGFGHITGDPDALIERFSEEHGMVKLSAKHSYQVGDIIHVIPNHICSTINLHNKVYLRDGEELEEIMVAGRGKLE